MALVRLTTLALIQSVMQTRLKLIIAVAVAYIFAYMLVVGIISYYPTFDLSSVFSTIPYVRLTSIGIIAALSNHLYFFAFYHAIAFMMITAFLLGLNIALLLYARGLRCCTLPAINRTFAPFIPAFFTSFACCGGGILVYAIGPVAFGYLGVYSIYFAIITVTLLVRSNHLTARMILQHHRSINGMKR